MKKTILLIAILTGLMVTLLATIITNPTLGNGLCRSEHRGAHRLP